MMRSTILSATIATAMLTSPVAARAGVQVNGASAYAGATAIIITGKTPKIKEKDASASLKTGRHRIDAAVSSEKNDLQGDRAFDHEDVYANFMGSTAGTVDLSGNSTSLALTPNKIAEAYNSGSSFDYDFTLTGEYTFSLVYLLSETDNFYFDNYYQLISTAGGPPIISGSPVDGSYSAPTIGGDEVRLGPGAYEFGVTAHLGDISGAQGPGFSAGSHVDQYEWSLTSAAPEPSEWLLLMLAVGGVGFWLRSGRRADRGGCARGSLMLGPPSA